MEHTRCSQMYNWFNFIIWHNSDEIVYKYLNLTCVIVSPSNEIVDLCEVSNNVNVLFITVLEFLMELVITVAFYTNHYNVIIYSYSKFASINIPMNNVSLKSTYAKSEATVRRILKPVVTSEAYLASGYIISNE